MQVGNGTTSFVRAKSRAMRPTWNKLRAKARMGELGMNYAGLARLLGYERQAVGHWFRDRGAPNMKDMHRIAAALGISVTELINEDAEIAVGEAQREVVRLMKEAAAADQDMVLSIVRAALASRKK